MTTTKNSLITLISFTMFSLLLAACTPSDPVSEQEKSNPQPLNTQAQENNSSAEVEQPISIETAPLNSTNFKYEKGVYTIELNKDNFIKAIGTYDDGSTKELTEVGQWFSSDGDVASISATGQIISNTPGLFTATLGYEDVESNELLLKIVSPQ